MTARAVFPRFSSGSGPCPDALHLSSRASGPCPDPHKNRRPAALLLLLIALLAGCASPVIRPGRHSIDGLEVSTPVAWSAQGKAGQRLWTRDGPLLNALRIFTDIAPGEPVFRGRMRGPKDEGTRFRLGLGAVEIEELIVEALRAGGLRNVHATDLRPARLDGKPGLRSEISCDSSTGLHYRGLLLAEGEDGSLSFLLYLAPAEHYFDNGRAAVEKIFASAAE